jgi:hypothetical protein
MTSLLLVLALLAVGNQSEEKKVPKDSVQISAPGCLKGRVFTATPQREGVDVVSGPDVTGRHFRLAGPKDVMKTVKENDAQGGAFGSRSGDEGRWLAGHHRRTWRRSDAHERA